MLMDDALQLRNSEITRGCQQNPEPNHHNWIAAAETKEAAADTGEPRRLLRAMRLPELTIPASAYGTEKLDRRAHGALLNRATPRGRDGCPPIAADD